MADFIADPDGVVMKSGMVLAIAYSQDDLRDIKPSVINHHYEYYNEGSVAPGTDQQATNGESSILITTNHQPINGIHALVMDQKLEDLDHQDIIMDLGEINIGNQEIIKMIDETNGGNFIADVEVGGCNAGNITNNTTKVLVLMESLIAPDDSINRDGNVVDHQTSQIAIPEETSKEMSNNTTGPTVSVWNEKYHKIFAEILKEALSKAEKEATRRAIEAVSSNDLKDSTCFEDIVSKALMDYVVLYQKACELSLQFEQENSTSNLSMHISKNPPKNSVEATKAKNGNEGQKYSPNVAGIDRKQTSSCVLKAEFEYELPEEEEEEEVNRKNNHSSKDDSLKNSPEVTYGQMMSMNKQSGYQVLNVERNSFASLGYEMMGNLSSEYNYPLGKMGNLSLDWYSQQGTSDWSGTKDKHVDKSYGYIPSVSTTYASPNHTELGDWKPGEDPFQRKTVSRSSQAIDDFAMKRDGSRKRVVPIINTKSKKFSPPTK